MQQRNRRRPLSTVFIAIGLLIFLGVAGAWGWQQWQGQALRNRLAAQPPATSVAATPAPVETASMVQSTPAATPVMPAPATSTAPVPSPSATPTTTPSPTPEPGTQPVRMLIPDLKLDVPVADMTWKVVNTDAGPQSEWEVPEYAAGWAVNSARLGDPNNVVLSGHNNIFGRVFMPISQAWPSTGVEQVDSYTERADILNGRKVEMLGADGRRFSYVITAFYRIKDLGVPLDQRIANARWMDPTGRAQLTLTTCWPPWSNTHRLVVVAEPAP